MTLPARLLRDNHRHRHGGGAEPVAPSACRHDPRAACRRNDRREFGADLAPIGNSPVVILVRPQLADNIGPARGAWRTGGLFHLVLVAPRDGWPQEKAWAQFSRCRSVLWIARRA